MPATRRSLGLFLAVLAGGLQAADQPAAAQNSDDSIAAAKRDFDALKNARTTSEPQRLNVPTPTLHLTDDEMTAFLQSEAAEKKKEKEKENRAAKNKNWLVDAMAEKTPGESEPLLKSSSSSQTATSGSLNLVNDLAASSNSADKNAVVTKGTPTLGNPLSGYMEGWMTQKDFELLKVKPADGAGPGVAPVRGPDRAADSLADLGRRDGRPSSGLATLSPGAPEPRSNPYLADFGPMPNGTGLKDTFNLPPPVASPAPLAGPSLLPPPKATPPPVRNEPSPADALRPTNDAKYFPQLKRF